MKKCIFSLLTVLAFAAGTSAQTITVADDVEALAGETVSVSLHIEGVEAMTSNRFVMTLPEGIVFAGVEATAEWPGMFSANKETGEFASIVSSDKALTGDGDIATIKLTVAEGAANGAYTVRIGGVRVNGVNLETEASFNVNVVSAHTVVLDENATEAPAAAEGVNVKVKRTIKADEWSTIVLPFAMTAEQVKAAFGEDVRVADFTGCDVDDETGNIDVKFADVTAIEANHPYIIKVKADVSEFSAENVNIAPVEEPAIDLDEQTTGSGRNKVTTYDSFIGNYVSGTLVPDYGIFLSGNKFWFSTGNSVLKAFRAYFDLATAGAEYESETRIFIAFDETTGITSAKQEKGKAYIYTIAGQQVKQTRKGLFIQNGKKVIVK